MRPIARYVALPAVMACFAATIPASLSILVTMTVKGVIQGWKINPVDAMPAWWEYAWYYGSDPRFTMPLILTGAIPWLVAFAGIAIATARYQPRIVKPYRKGMAFRPPERAASRAHGSADWLDMDTAKEIFSGPHPIWGGFPVGEAFRPPFADESILFNENKPETWAGGGKAPVLLSTLERGALSGLTFAGSGSYKTMSIVIPACRYWLGSMVILDPSSQVGHMAAHVRRAMGQTVALVSLKDTSTGSMNVLRWIDLEGPEATVQLEEFVSWCGSQYDDRTSSDSENGKFFAESARELELCLLADLLHDPKIPENRKTVREWRRRMATPQDQMPKELKRIHAESPSAYARDLAGTMFDMKKTADKTWASIYKHMTSEMRWLADPRVADLLSNDSFEPAEILAGRLTVITQIPDYVLKNVPQIARVIMGTLARVVLSAQGQTTTPVPFILDEMKLLGKMRIFEIVRDLGRKSGIGLFPIWQSPGQMEEDWGEKGARAWYASAGWQLYAAVSDPKTAEYLEGRCGKYTAIVHNEGKSVNQPSWFGGNRQGGGRSTGTSANLSEVGLPLLTAYEIQTRIRPDCAFLVPRGQPVALVGLPMWWRRDELRDLFKQDNHRRAAA